MATKKTTTKTKKAAAKPAKATRVTTVKAVEGGSSRRSNKKGSKSPLDQAINLMGRPVTAASIAEFIGVFLLATVVLVVHNEPFWMLFGIISIFMLVGGISGAHLNPAITVGAWITRRVNLVRASSYIIAQVLGAMLALVVMNQFLQQAPSIPQEAINLGQTSPELFTANELPEGKEMSVFLAEMIGVAILGFAYASVLKAGSTVKKKLTAAFTVGGAGFVALAFAGTAVAYVSASAALNPAIAVTLKAFSTEQLWWSIAIYAVAGLIGSIIGFGLHDLIRNTEEA